MNRSPDNALESQRIHQHQTGGLYVARVFRQPIWAVVKPTACFAAVANFQICALGPERPRKLLEPYDTAMSMRQLSWCACIQDQVIQIVTCMLGPVRTSISAPDIANLARAIKR